MKTDWERWAARFRETNRCIYARTEGLHRVACNKEAEYRSKDRLPACEDHVALRLRERWKGFIEGA